MGLGEWIGRRVHNWTTKPFPEGMPPANGAKSSTPAATSSPTKSSPSNRMDASPSAPAQTIPAIANETPKESAQEIAEKIMILIPYIKQYRSQGMLAEEIESFLKEHGWPEYIVRKALQKA
ncbi:MAG: hypothetical protein FJY86_01815 [Candidatus Diapherotrites archaeon]|uniref:Uncharacterized protein n=1 Tax=Candidatus Iainarchaeum sp. TaxID=3101447 RepID=A0A8T4C6E4_9ARCH|nr:hypothetical protein [Candidatus Diapherotrites archaeon]